MKPPTSMCSSGRPSWVFDVPGYLAPYPPQVNWLDRNFPYLTNFVRFTGCVYEPSAEPLQGPPGRPGLRRPARGQRVNNRSGISGSLSCESKFGRPPRPAWRR